MEVIDYTTGFWLDEIERITELGGGVFDGDIYECAYLSDICNVCCNFIGYVRFAPTCKVFPKGIPPDIWLEKNTCQKFCKK